MQKTAIIIPYRDRKAHLNAFLRAWDFDKGSVFIIEQEKGKPFNRGKLLNVGFAEASESFTHFIFHDVDLLPLEVDYSPADKPTHICHHLHYQEYFGGVTMFNEADFASINGFSNEFWGYGAEDDHLLLRVKHAKLEWQRRMGKFEALPHKYNGGNEIHNRNAQRFYAIRDGRFADNTGLNDLKYQIKEFEGDENVFWYKVAI
jgi:beta-1,4-galactosyltransferase 1